jgi:alpha-L-fucosidase
LAYPTKKWKASGKSAALKNTFDGNPKTLLVIENAQPEAHELTLDMGELLTLSGFTYMPSTADDQDGNIYRYNFLVSTDGKRWTSAIENGVFGNIKNNPILQEIGFDKPQQARYIRLQSLQSADGKFDKTTIAELGVKVVKEDK